MRARTTIAFLACLALGLCGGIAYLYRAPPAPEPQARSSIAESEAVIGLDTHSFESQPPPPAQAQLAFNWRSVESDDLKQYLSNLRAIECPEETIRDILLAKVRARFAEREGSSRFTPPETSKPWGARANLSEADLGRAREWRAVQLEMRALVKELLGMEMPLDVLRSTYTRNYEEFEAAFEALPASKRDRVQTMKEEYWQESDALKEKYKGGSHADYVEEYRQLNRRHQEELARVLSPRDLEDLLMRTSVTGNTLATQLADFGPTEEEFRKVFRITRKYEEETGRVGGQYGMVGVEGETRTAARQEMHDRVRSALDEERFAEFERFQDGAYRDLVRVADHYGLPREAARQAYQLEKAYGEARRRLKEEPQPPTEEEERFDKIEAEFLDTQVELLGERAAKAYSRLRSGQKGDDDFEP